MRHSVSRLLALWAVLAGTSPLPMLLASSHAHAAPRLGSSAHDDRDWSDAGGIGGSGISVPAPTLASLGTLDELIGLWPNLAHADGLLFFVDFDDFVIGGFPLEVWGVFGEDAVMVGGGAYMPLHESEPVSLPSAAGDRSSGDGGVEGGADRALGTVQLQTAIGILTAADGSSPGSEIGFEGMKWLWELVDPYPTTLPPVWGGEPSVEDGTVRPMPTPMLPVRSMPVPEAIEAAEEQTLIDASGEPQPQCVHPTWVGNDGVQCCQLYLSDEALEHHCSHIWWLTFIACTGVEGIISVYFVEAIKRCLSVPLANKACVAAILGAAVVLVAVCWSLASYVHAGCVAEKRHLNEALLISLGCDPHPPTD